MSTQHVAPLPVCKAILLCDRVVESNANKLSLNGVFSNFIVGSELNASQAEVFCQITDAQGRYSVVVEVHDLTSNQVIARSKPTDVDIPDPLFNMNIIVAITPLRFHNAGLHDVVVFANGEEIDRKQFGVAIAEDETHVDTI